MENTFVNTTNLPGEDSIFRKAFENGSTFLSYPNPNSPAVFFRGYLPVGGLSDPNGKNGLASLHASMLSTGTLKREFRQLHNEIESCGASISIRGGSLSTLFSGQCLKEDLPVILNLLLEMLSLPAFPQTHFERLKQQLAVAFKIQAQNTEAMAAQAFDRLYYHGHPYAVPDIGYPETIAAITLEDLQEFHHRYFGPNGLVLAISGGMESEATSALFENIFSTWEAPEQNKQADLPLWQPQQKAQQEHVAIPEKSQSDLIIGTSAPSGGTDESQICGIGNTILGQFGMMGRIGESVRERSGLAYYAGSSLRSGLGPSTWQVYAGVNPANLDKATVKIIDELKRFTNEKVTNEELADVKTQSIGQLPLSLENNSSIAALLLSLQRYNHSLNYLRDLPKKLEEISAEDILLLAQKYWQLDSLVITSAGKAR
jgi:zinc protease